MFIFEKKMTCLPPWPLTLVSPVSSARRSQYLPWNLIIFSSSSKVASSARSAARDFSISSFDGIGILPAITS